MSFSRTGDFFTVRKRRHTLSNPLLSPVAVTLLYDQGKSRGNKYKPTTIGIRMSGPLLDELEWVPHTYIEVMEGTGHNAGKVLLRLADDPIQGYKLSYTSHVAGSIGHDHRLNSSGLYPSCTVKVGIGGVEHHTVELEGARPRGTTVEHRVYNSELLVTMPTWFKPTQESIHRVRRVIEHEGPTATKRKYVRRNQGEARE